MPAYAPLNAWLGFSTDTTFNPSTMAVYEFIVLALTLNHEEGQIPTVDVTMRRPGWPGQSIGLITSGAPTWAWFSYNPPPSSPLFGSGPIPFFFGILIGQPADLFKEKIQVRYQARSINFILNKQAVAETLKVRPFWDPVFIDEKLRSDPDTVANAWSGLYHFSRIPTDGDFVTSFSDFLVGEDGTVTFAGQSDDELIAFYDSVRMEIGEAPLTNVQVQARVKWTQRTYGWVDLPPVAVATYTGESFLDDWLKPNQQLGGGWSVEQGFVQDVYAVGLTPTATASFHWSATPTSTWTGGLTFPTLDIPSPECQEQSSDYSHTYPLLSTPTGLSFTMSLAEIVGQCQAAQIDITGNSIPAVNRPGKYALNGVIIPVWYLNGTAQLRYDPKREFTEVAVFNIKSNLQPILTEPLVEQNTELIRIDGADVGNPVIVYDAWTTFAGKSVPIAQIILPNNPTTPGGLSWQICTTPGVAGTTEPIFSDIPGTITIDGTVHWASMGPDPLTNLPGWNPNSPVPAGQIICYQPVEFDTNRGTFEATGESIYYLCTTGGTTNGIYSSVTWYPPPATSDVTVILPVQVAYIPGPATDATPGDQISDGSVVWTSLGSNPPFLTIPIGGDPLNVTARCYFPTDRGLWSIEYLIARARARLRKKARAVTLKWQCPFEHALGLSCRMNAALLDQRLPGGQAVGKIKKYSMWLKGNGELRGYVEIGVAIGNGGGVHEIAGTPTYVQEGYVQRGYQQYTGQQLVLTGGTDDILYAPPLFSPFDDGYNFPLGGAVVATSAAFPGNITINLTSGLQAELAQGFFTSVRLQDQAAFITASGQAQGGDLLGASTTLQTAYNSTQLQILLNNLAANPVWVDLLLPPFTNGPFNGSYAITTTPMEVEMGINLQA